MEGFISNLLMLGASVLNCVWERPGEGNQGGANRANLRGQPGTTMDLQMSSLLTNPPIKLVRPPKVIHSLAPCHDRNERLDLWPFVCAYVAWSGYVLWRLVTIGTEGFYLIQLATYALLAIHVRRAREGYPEAGGRAGTERLSRAGGMREGTNGAESRPQIPPPKTLIPTGGDLPVRGLERRQPGSPALPAGGVHLAGHACAGRAACVCGDTGHCPPGAKGRCGESQGAKRRWDRWFAPRI